MWAKPTLAVCASILAVGIWSQASGQGGNPTCPTRPPGTHDNSCASTAFVVASAVGVSSVRNLDGTLTISPTGGHVIASLNLANPNTWTALQQFNDQDFALKGSTSGSVKVVAPAIAGSATATFFSGSDTIVGVATPQALTNKTYNGLTITSTTGILTITSGKTASFTNTNTWTGTDSATYTFPSASATIPRMVASGTKALATSPISSSTCSGAQSASAVGALTTDVINAGFNGDPTSVTGYIPTATGMLAIVPYPSADNVNFKVCNNTAATITPGGITLNWQVIR